jgi:AcrR family transcriptional regulator
VTIERATPPSDLDTRERLLQAATALFAERGFEKVTVRDIVAAAGANVAAVNYHFAGKLGLYTEVIDRAISLVQSAHDGTHDAPEGSSAEERLRFFVHSLLALVDAPADLDSVYQLLRHEMENPTPAAQSILRRVMQPRMRYLCQVISELTGGTPEDEHVRNCAMSVQAQCYFVRNMIRMKGRLRAAGLAECATQSGDDLNSVAEHIVRFSLAGIATSPQ